MDIKTLLHNLPLPNADGQPSERTLGDEKAAIRVQENPLEIVLTFGYPMLWAQPYLERAIGVLLAQNGLPENPRVVVQSHIGTHQVQQGVKTIGGVKNIIAIASGKGGVGKSTTTTQLALSLQQMGARVGVLDADLYGPSQPTMLGVADVQPEPENGRMKPVRNADGVQVMSIGFLVDPQQAVVWRGPMVSQALQQLLFQSDWEDVDYLLIDLPPGTGDIQLTLSQRIPVTGAVIVTTPQDIALLDARKAVDMFQKVNIPIIGLIENMSMHVCSECGHAEPIFGQNGGRELADTLHVPLLGQMPLSLPIREAMDAGEGGQLLQAEPELAAAYRDAALKITQILAQKARDFSNRFPKIVVE